MTVLSRGERFKDARVTYNRHGKQTMKEVEEGTGVSASMIKDLEDDESTRSVGYDKVAKLAAYYGVSADWLLGLTQDHNRIPAATDELGLSPYIVNQIYAVKTGKTSSDKAAMQGLNDFLSRALQDISFFRHISNLRNAVEIERLANWSNIGIPGIMEATVSDSTENNRMAEVMIWKALEDAYPGITNRVHFTFGPCSLKPRVDEICDTFREMLEEITGYTSPKGC